MQLGIGSLAAATLTISSLVAQPAMAQSQTPCGSLATPDEPAVGAPSPVETIALNPPTDRDLPITIRDTRMLSDGGQAEFTIHNRLRFTRGQGGMIATLRRDAVDCTGSDAVCEAYRGAMAAWVGSVQRFAVTADGRVATLIRAELDGVGAGSAGATELIGAAEARNPGMLGEAELREAMRYVGHAMVANDLADQIGLQQDEVAITYLPDNQAAVWSRVVVRLESDPEISLINERCDRVDLSTGLLVESASLSKAAEDLGSPISDRRWTLGR